MEWKEGYSMKTSDVLYICFRMDTLLVVSQKMDKSICLVATFLEYFMLKETGIIGTNTVSP